MTRQEKIERSKFLIENLGSDLKNTAEIILSDPLLDDGKIINTLLEYLNRGSTYTKLLSSCIICGDSDIKCFACDQLIEEVEKYRK